MWSYLKTSQITLNSSMGSSKYSIVSETKYINKFKRMKGKSKCIALNCPKKSTKITLWKCISKTSTHRPSFIKTIKKTSKTQKTINYQSDKKSNYNQKSLQDQEFWTIISNFWSTVSPTLLKENYKKLYSYF